MSGTEKSVQSAPEKRVKSLDHGAGFQAVVNIMASLGLLFLVHAFRAGYIVPIDEKLSDFSVVLYVAPLVIFLLGIAKLRAVKWPD